MNQESDYDFNANQRKILQDHRKDVLSGEFRKRLTAPVFTRFKNALQNLCEDYGVYLVCDDPYIVVEVHNAKGNAGFDENHFLDDCTDGK